MEVGRQEEGPGRVIRLTGLGDLDETLRGLLAAQIVWTLSTADVRGPWLLEADGAPLIESHPGPWTRDSDELRPLDPTKGRPIAHRCTRSRPAASSKSPTAASGRCPDGRRRAARCWCPPA